MTHHDIILKNKSLSNSSDYADWRSPFYVKAIHRKVSEWVVNEKRDGRTKQIYRLTLKGFVTSFKAIKNLAILS